MFNDAVGTWDSLQNKEIGVTITTRRVGGSLDDGSDDPHRARGGPVKRGKPYIVGEDGAEVFVPYAPGFIIPNNAAPYTDPGSKVAQNFNMSAPSITINSVSGAAIAHQISRQYADVARRARARASLTG